MKQGFLEREAKQAHKKNRIFFTVMLLGYICLLSVLAFVLKDSIDLNDPDIRKVVITLSVLSVIMLISVAAGLLSSLQSGAEGRSLILPFKEDTKKAVARIIDQEVLEGRVLVDEYTEDFSDGQKPHGQRILLTPSYLLLFNSMGRVFAIPRGKICWICSQTGIKGRSPYKVRLLVFTDKKIFSHMDGLDIPHMEKIAEKLYEYIPNAFSGRDPFTTSHELERLFEQDREAFLRLYEEEKKKFE